MNSSIVWVECPIVSTIGEGSARIPIPSRPALMVLILDTLIFDSFSALQTNHYFGPLTATE